MDIPLEVSQLSTMNAIVPTQYSLTIMEKLLVGALHNESILLVSETGCGKTTLVQHLAHLLNKRLHVFNMSLGSDVGDLVGGFKPVDCKVLLRKLLLKYIKHFNRLPVQTNNEKYLASLQTLQERGENKRVLEAMIKSLEMVKQKANTGSLPKWEKLEGSIMRMYDNVDRLESNLVFMFLEGNLLKALKNGDWILVDEINLASN